MKYRAYILVFVGVAILILAAISIIGIRNTQQIARADRGLFYEGTVALPELSAASVAFEKMRIASRDLLETVGTPEQDQFARQMDALAVEMDQRLRAYEKTGLNSLQRLAFEECLLTQRNYLGHVARLRGFVRNKAPSDGWGMLHSAAYNADVDAHLAAIRKLEGLQVRKAKEIIDRNGELAQTAILQTVVAMSLAILFMILGAVWIDNIAARNARAQEAIRQSERRFELASLATNDAIWDSNLVTDESWWNKKFKEMIGPDADNAEPGYEVWASRIHPDDRIRVCESSKNAVAQGQNTWSAEYRFRRADGSYADVFDRWYVSRDIAGRPVRMVGAMMDISERKRIEALYRTLFEGVDDAVLITDVLPDGTLGRFREVNDVACRKLGYSRGEFLQLSPADIDAPGFSPRREAAVEITAKGGHALFEMELVTRDGRHIAVEISASVLQVNNQPMGMAIVRDISARKRAEEELRAAKDLAETANRVKSEFLANMSHEVRTPMNAILGLTELALDTPLTDEQREYLLAVQSSGESLLRLLNDILDFSKMEAGKLDLELIEFDLHKCIGDTAKTLALRAHEKGLELACQLGPEVPRRVVGDPVRLRQILINLIGNAIKFTHEGEVVIRVYAETAGEDKVGLHFQVRDTGIGIPHDKQPAIFKAFVQGDTSVTRLYGGTGLGLAICVRLIDLMNGTIHVESEPGKGSSFEFTIPAKIPSAAALPPPATLESLRGVRVLIVDDNSTNREILVRNTAGWEMLPHAVESAEEAIRELEASVTTRPYRVALIDALMPGMDGFALAERVQQDPRLAETVIMMLTSSAQRGDAARCRSLGIAAYLVKPIGNDEMLRALLAALGNAEEKKRPLVTRHTAAEQTRALRILVAEDNPVNQTLILKFLQKHGHTTELARTGSEAVALAASGRFDLAFMDLQMPELDGLAATTAIRRSEQETGSRLPIYAMTAHAMKGDELRCLDAGMDGYVPKPLNFAAVLQILAQTAAGEAKPWNRQEALSRMGEDEELLRETAAVFLDETPRLLSLLERALAEQDAGTLGKTAHRLKGSVGCFTSGDALTAVAAVEESANSGDFASARVELNRATRALNALCRSLEKFCKVAHQSPGR